MSQVLGYLDPSNQARALAGKQPRRPPDEVLGGENAPMRETWNLGRAVSHLLTGGRCPFKKILRVECATNMFFPWWSFQLHSQSSIKTGSCLCVDEVAS